MLPFLLRPYLKTVIWGGSSLSEYKQLNTRLERIGESWEVSAIPGCESIIDSGEYKGMLLSELCRLKGASLLGNEVYERFGDEMPLLVKFIDAADDLSIQVHPDDNLAHIRHDCRGKGEMWYIINSKPGSTLVNGLKTDISEDEFRRRVADGTFNEVLARFKPKAGEVYYLPAGRIHAIGKGNLLFEVQQASDITYRIFDYNRRDTNGNLRELHVDLAIDAIDYEAIKKTDSETLPASTPHFKLDKAQLKDSEITIENANFTIVTCIEGTVTATAEGSDIKLPCGHTMIIPAHTATRIQGSATLLIINP